VTTPTHTTAPIPAANYTPLSKDQIAAPLDLAQRTTSPIKIASGAFVPEWTDHKGARVLFGFSRSHLYELLAEGKIRSTCVRRRGALRGRRLFCCESIRALLNKHAE
jgi:hypothetical protein